VEIPIKPEQWLLIFLIFLSVIEGDRQKYSGKKN
jgi:hypothetical protein